MKTLRRRKLPAWFPSQMSKSAMHLPTPSAWGMKLPFSIRIALPGCPPTTLPGFLTTLGEGEVSRGRGKKKKTEKKKKKTRQGGQKMAPDTIYYKKRRRDPEGGREQEERERDGDWST